MSKGYSRKLCWLCRDTKKTFCVCQRNGRMCSWLGGSEFENRMTNENVRAHRGEEVDVVEQEGAKISQDE